MQLDDHKNLAQDIIARVQKNGGETAAVKITFNTEKEVSIREQKIETLTQSNSSLLSLTVSKKMKRASVSSNDFSERALAALVKDALALADYMGVDESYDLPEKELLGRAEQDLRLFDPAESQVAVEKRIAMAQELESRALGVSKDLISDGASVSSNSGHIVLANSRDFCEGYQYSQCSLSVSCAVSDSIDGLNSARKQSGWWYSTGRSFASLESIEHVASTAAKRTLDKRGAKKPKTQVVPVIFENTVAASVLGFLNNAISGANIYTKQSFLVEKLGKNIAGENITVIEDPLLPGQLGSRPFDGEGVRSRRKVIVERGVLKTFLLDTYTAKKLNARSTGNAGGVSNFYLESGSSSLQDIIKSVENGVLVTSLSGFGEILQTGDYSRGAQGFWIEHGKIASAVNEFTIASNLIEMLNNVEMIGNDPLKTGSMYCPSLKIKSMTVSGA